VPDVNCDNAVAPYACSRLWALLNDNAHDWSRVLGKSDQPHPKIAAKEGMTGLANRKLPQIGHKRPCTPGGAGRDEPVGDLLDE
jgi:hypothetical protein